MVVTERVFTSTSITLHWLVAIGIIGMLAFGFVIAGMERGPEKTAAIQLHKSFGVIVGGLALARLLWRTKRGFPPPISGTPSWQARTADVTHRALLLLTVVMPVTGILKSVTYARPVEIFGLPLLPQLLAEKNEALNGAVSLAHAGAGYSLAAVCAAHAAAAIAHHVIARDETLLRMLMPASTGSLTKV